MTKRIWITWETQRRNRTLSRELGARLFEFDLKANRYARYLIAFGKTLAVFIKERPAQIFVQNPSLVLSFIAVSYGQLLNIPVIVDAHNAGVYPFDGRKEWANRIAVYIFRHAAFTIVTNEALAMHVRGRGGRPAIVPDPLPEFEPQPAKRQLNGAFNVLFICSWATDEPYEEVIKAALLLDKTTCIYITGNSKGREKNLGLAIPENIILTGYLSEENFVEMLFSSDIVMDLTTREDCLVCGAYEAVAAEKPLILSDTEALRQYFYKGVLYTDNTAQNLAELINKSIKNKDNLTCEILELKNQISTEWTTKSRIPLEKSLANMLSD